MSTANAFKLIFKKNDRIIELETLLDLVKQKQTKANLEYQNKITFIPGAEAFIYKLATQKKRLFVASSGSALNVKTGLQKLLIHHFFEAVVTANDITNAKPHPEIFLKIIKDFSLDPAETIVIEDANSGINAAIAAGLNVVVVHEKIILGEENKHVPIINFESLINNF